jgi:hypothetical protein
MCLGNWSYGRTNSYASREKRITARHPMVIDDAGFPADRKVLARSLAGHIVAGVAEEGEVEAFRELCAKLGG